MDYQWDPAKAKTNVRKHDIRFADAISVFSDDNAITMEDDDPGEDPWNRSGYFNKLNRGKLNLCMNILEPEGRAVLHELIAQADVVIDQ